MVDKDDTCHLLHLWRRFSLRVEHFIDPYLYKFLWYVGSVFFTLARHAPSSVFHLRVDNVSSWTRSKMSLISMLKGTYILSYNGFRKFKSDAHNFCSLNTKDGSLQTVVCIDYKQVLVSHARTYPRQCVADKHKEGSGQLVEQEHINKNQPRRIITAKACNHCCIMSHIGL